MSDSKKSSGLGPKLLITACMIGGLAVGYVMFGDQSGVRPAAPADDRKMPAAPADGGAPPAAPADGGDVQSTDSGSPPAALANGDDTQVTESVAPLPRVRGRAPVRNRDNLTKKRGGG